MSEREVEGKAELWNPKAAAWLSLIFTPAFGALIHASNWQAMGDHRRMMVARVWACGMLFALCVIYAAGTYFREISTLSTVSSFAGPSLLLLWYAISGRSQARYVATNLGEIYVKKGWFKPIIIAISIVVAILFIFGAIQYGSIQKSIKEGEVAGQDSSISDCFEQTMSRMYKCSGYECEAYEVGFSKGCAATSTPDKEFCSQIPESVLDAASVIRQTCKGTKFSEKGCYNSLKSYAARCLQ